MIKKPAAHEPAFLFTNLMVEEINGFGKLVTSPPAMVYLAD
jgi:hypothetical protein